jgi:hypothetical protein
MREELGIRVQKIALIRVRYYTTSNGERQRIHYFRIKDWKGRIRSNEAEAVYWESDISHLSDTIEKSCTRTFEASLLSLENIGEEIGLVLSCI